MAFDAMPGRRNRFQKVLGERNDWFLALRGAAFGLVALNGFFVATEFALVKVRPTARRAGRRGSAAARRAKRLVEHLDEYLSATQLESRSLRWR